MGVIGKPAGSPGPPRKPGGLGGKKKARGDGSYQSGVKAGFGFKGRDIQGLPVKPDGPVHVGRKPGPKST